MEHEQPSILVIGQHAVVPVKLWNEHPAIGMNGLSLPKGRASGVLPRMRSTSGSAMASIPNQASRVAWTSLLCAVGAVTFVSLAIGGATEHRLCKSIKRRLMTATATRGD